MDCICCVVWIYNGFILWILSTLSFAHGEIHLHVEPHQGTHVRAGKTARFTCSAVTDYRTTFRTAIVWLKNDQPIAHNHHHRYRINHRESTLTIINTRVDDTGVITCNATFKDYKVHKSDSTQLVVQDVPDPPINVRLESCHSRLAQISWDLINENNSPVQYFIIQYNTSFKPNTWHIAKTANTRNKLIARIALSPWGNYTFRVIARNSIGDGEPSEPTEEYCTAPPDVPHHNPRHVCTANEAARTLIVTWQKMEQIEHNAPGFHYLVRWKRYDAPESTEFSTRTVAAETARLVLGDQPIYRPYEVYVLAVNSVGEAVTAPRAVIGYSGEDVPLDAPYHFKLDDDYYVTNTTAHFMWEPVKTVVNRIRGFFRGYRIEFWKTENPSQRKVHDIILDEPDLCKGIQTPDRKRRKVGHGQVRNLWPYTNITAHIRVLNMKYTGPPSNRVNFQTKQGVPGAVKMFQIISTGSTHIVLRWRRPNVTNGLLVGYTVSYKAIKDHSGPKTFNDIWPINNPNQARLKLLNLRPHTSYRLSICARTWKGCGTGYAIEGATLPASAPWTPDFRAVNINKTKLNVTWLPSTSGDPGCKFSVSYRPLGKLRWTESADIVDREWHVVAGLRYGSVYEVRVIAKNCGDAEFYRQTTSPIRQIQIGEKINFTDPVFKIMVIDEETFAISLMKSNKMARVYYIQYREAGSSKWSATDDVEIQEVGLVRNLIQGVMYEIRVVTRSPMGEYISKSLYKAALTDSASMQEISGGQISRGTSQGINRLVYLQIILIILVFL